MNFFFTEVQFKINFSEFEMLKISKKEREAERERERRTSINLLSEMIH